MQVIEGTLKRLKELNKPFKYIGKRNLANAHASGPCRSMDSTMTRSFPHHSQ